MPLDKLVLIIVCVVAAAGLTIWGGLLLTASLNMHPIGWVIAGPAALVAYIVWRVIADRVGNAEDDHYDKIEK